MKIAALILTIALGVCRVAEAQTQVIGHGLAGGGFYSGWFGGGGIFHVAGGADVLARGVAGVGGEFGIMGNAGSALTVGSVNGIARIPGDTTAGFVSGGYTRLSSGEGTFHVFNVGGGADFWQNDHLGIRVDVRDHIRSHPRGAIHYISIRIGVAMK